MAVATIIKYLESEGAAIRAAPVAFAVATLAATALFGIGLFLVFDWHFSELIAIKDAHIKMLQDTSTAAGWKDRDTGALPNKAQSKISHQQSQVSELSSRRWVPLTKEEILAMQGTLRALRIRRVSIYCRGSNCDDLATGFDALFKELDWRPEIIPSFVTLKSLYEGIYLWPDNNQTQAIAAMVAQGTEGRLLVKIAPVKSSSSDEISLFIGDKPGE